MEEVNYILTGPALVIGCIDILPGNFLFLYAR